MDGYKSEGIVATCGDSRVARFILDYLEKEYGLREVDLLTTAGGSRVVSLYEVKEEELEIFKTKQQAFWVDLNVYLGHNAETFVWVDHGTCGFWPLFKSDGEEEIAHIQSLIKARDIILKNCPQIKRVILIYVIVRENKAVEVKIISPAGKN